MTKVRTQEINVHIEMSISWLKRQCAAFQFV